MISLLRQPRWMKPFIEEPSEVNDETVPEKKQGLPWVAILLFVLAIIGFVLQALLKLASPSILLAIAAFHLILVRPRTASIFLLLIYTTLFVLQVSTLASTLEPDRWDSGIYNLVIAIHVINISISLISIAAVVNLPLRDPSLSREGICQPFNPPTAELRSPEDSLTLWQWMTVSWMSSLISVGKTRQLNEDDVWFLGYEFQHRHLHDAFRELHGTVVRRLLRANWVDLALLTVLAILELAANYSAPILLQQLLKAMANLRFEKKPAISFAVLILVVRLVAAQSAVFSLWFGRRAYERSRGEMITMLYEKTLNRKIVATIKDKTENQVDETQDEDSDRDMPSSEDGGDESSRLLNGHTSKTNEKQSFLSKILKKTRAGLPFSRSKKSTPVTEDNAPASMGKILNLMRGDVYEVSQRFWEFQTLINKPLGMILSLCLVWNLLGPSCLLGVAVVVIAQILNGIFASILVKKERLRRKATDVKLQQVSAYVEAIRHLRWYGWHPVWLERILEARQSELDLKVITYLWTNAIRFVNILGSGLLPVAAFYGFTALAGHELRIDIAFPALQLFNMLQSDLREIPGLITVLLNASVAVGRIEAFMKEPNKTADDNSASTFADVLELRAATFAWPGLSKNVLHNLTISFPPGLTIVFGQVAAGKSALLQALLGELDLHDGELIKPDAPIGYCAQAPWLQSMSIRDNILFSSPYDDVRYKQTLEACALTADLANLKHGDLSNIGENGIGLSGGQKARVALARAIYSRAKILLLDDPLSALDQQTAESIVAKCFGGDLVKGRTVVLVTHRTDLCKGLAEQLVEITDGTAQTSQGDSLHLSPTNSHTAQTLQDAKMVKVDEAQESAAVPDKFEEEEHREHGGVKAAVYWQYIKAGRLKWWFLVILSAATFRLLMVAESWLFKEWGEAYKEVEQVFSLQILHADSYVASSSPVSRLFARFPDPGVNVYPWLIAFFVLIIVESLALLVSQIFMLVITYTAGKGMFKDIMDKVSHTTFHYYDVVPIGRLMNRLTSDVATIDGNISDQFLQVAWQAIAWVTSIAVIAGVTPLFLVFSIALTLLFLFIFMQFLPTSQSLRRLEMVSLSPLMSNFGALLNGLTTVRAFCAQSRFQDRVIAVTDAFQGMDHFYWSLQAWLMYRFDILSACSTFILTVLAINSGLSPGLTAFVLASASRFVVAVHALCKQYGQLQLNFVSVERVVELLHLEQEPAGEIDPPAYWPSYDSDVVFEKVTIRYAPHLDPALSDVSFTLKGGSNTAVIGRTGSGKSTLALSLLATMTPESGRILIGGIDIAKVNKQALRNRITFLAQDPVLFPGSLRHNLDPTEQHADDECETVIARVCGSYNWTLQTQIDTGGKNLSQGQRQLVGLARAVLRRSAIVIMDEATASIDKDTAWEIQRVLREEMKQSTVITIAHRPSAVRGANYCLALGDSKIIDQGSPEDVDVARSTVPDTI
ncbi:P-loop containing nucleoside triphosphate hydrolase protein [Aureobasidium pullulans]|nr:P-loop containing nucleoside triphosphate hydrolase protein [Aureobasidium pullulans]